MSEKQMSAEQKALAALDQLGAEAVWHGSSDVDSVYFTRLHSRQPAQRLEYNLLTS